MPTLSRSMGRNPQRDIFTDCAARRRSCVLGPDVKLPISLSHIHTWFVNISVKCYSVTVHDAGPHAVTLVVVSESVN